MSETPTFNSYLSQGEAVTAPDGTCIFQPGDEGGAFLIVTQGTVRVEQTNPEGRTVVLYRVNAGDSCVLTTTCLLTGEPYAGYGYAEGDITAVAIPAGRFHSLMAEDPAFQRMAFRGFAQRVAELTHVIDDLLMHRTDLRLARWLSRHGDGTDVQMTQQGIAQELGTAREVVSRALKSFEKAKWIKIGRGTVTICDAQALAHHSAQQQM
ncbi:MAG: Crp/Fnr family transcriptional regulator [Pseudomonadota bacterium]